ncbi:hypothetical protein BN1708_010704 [Verticillium longisporum]|uniref:Uncharacterized protein n=1 Tax=Verticillium longisporum TaxID=100787 RepID=A0A0G4KT77_VERLO|nr:hypothetical protein BN1708_010704 [Verticillium longisporum]
MESNSLQQAQQQPPPPHQPQPSRHLHLAHLHALIPPPSPSPTPPLRTAASTPMSSPGLFSPSNPRPRHNYPGHAASDSNTPVQEVSSPYLHPLQHHKVREYVQTDIGPPKSSLFRLDLALLLTHAAGRTRP